MDAFELLIDRSSENASIKYFIFLPFENYFSICNTLLLSSHGLKLLEEYNITFFVNDRFLFDLFVLSSVRVTVCPSSVWITPFFQFFAEGGVKPLLSVECICNFGSGVQA